MHCACDEATRKRKRERAVRVREARTDSFWGPSWTEVMRGDEVNTRTLLSHSYGYPLMSFCVLAQ